MRPLHTLSAITVAVALLLAAPAAATTIKIATIAPEDSPWHEVLQNMARAWEEASGGSIKTRLYPGGIAGDESDLIRKMRVGQLDAAMLTSGSLPEIARQLSVLHMPLTIETYGELDYVMAKLGPRFEELLLEQGFRTLAWGDVGWLHLFTTTPVVRPEDLRPLRLFMWSSNSRYIDVWKNMGFNPVPAPATEIHTALTTGMIQAVIVPPIAALSFQWFALANHMTDMPWVPMVGAVVMTERSWQKVPKELRGRFMEIAAAANAQFKSKIRAVAPQAIAAMKAHGLEVHEVPPEALAQWRAGVEKGFSGLVGEDVPADLLARMQSLVAEHRTRLSQQ